MQVQINLVDLEPPAHLLYTIIRMVTDEGVHREIDVGASPEDYEHEWKGFADMSRNRGQSACHVAHNLDYSANQITVDFPRSCLGDPRWLRIGAGIEISERADFKDDAMTAQMQLDTLKYTMSARIRRQ